MEKMNLGHQQKSWKASLPITFQLPVAILDCIAPAASMAHIANQVFLYLGKYTRNSYVSGGLNDEHSIPVQNSLCPGTMVSTICSFFVLALLLLKIGCKINICIWINKEIIQKHFLQGLQKDLILRIGRYYLSLQSESDADSGVKVRPRTLWYSVCNRLLGIGT